MSAAAEYPNREPFHAHRVVRLLAKSAAAQTLGPEGAWLVTTIAHVEDAKRYSGPVAFFNQQLMAICGFASEGRLIRTRERVVAEGWLNYQPGGKRRPATYFTMVPGELQAMPDGLDDESTPSDSHRLHFQNRSESEGDRGCTSVMEVYPKLSASLNGGPPTLALALNTSPGKSPDGQPAKAKGRKTKAPSFSTEDLQTAKAFWQRIITLQPERKPPRIEEWADSIRLMRERDHRAHSDVLSLLDRVQRDEFWRTVILSPDKLRTKWDDLMLKLRPSRSFVSNTLEPLEELKGVGT